MRRVGHETKGHDQHWEKLENIPKKKMVDENDPESCSDTFHETSGNGVPRHELILTPI